MTIGITETNLQVMSPPAQSQVRVSEAYVLATYSAEIAKRNVTQAVARVMGFQPAPKKHMTRAVVLVLATRTPNYAWIPMIFPDVFPKDISYNSVGTIRFATDVTVVDSGDDQRTRRWAQPLREYDISYGVRTMEDLQALIAFFNAMNGRLYAFHYRDWMDYTSSVAVAYEARRAPAISPFDQVLGVGDGNTFVFQLAKTYRAPTSGANLKRPIVRPEPGTVTIGQNGQQIENWTVDVNTGLVTFTPVLQLTAAMATNGLGASAVFSGVAGLFNPFRTYQNRRLVIAGFADPQNNGGLTDKQILVGGVSDDGSTMSVEYFAGGATAQAGTITLSIHPAPVTGATLTAGFQFFVPVRFDTDSLPLTLEDYGIGSAQSVKLIEIRPTAF